jgi:hypothetical protein
MNAGAWALVELGTRLLDPEEREVVLATWRRRMKPHGADCWMFSAWCCAGKLAFGEIHGPGLRDLLWHSPAAIC